MLTLTPRRREQLLTLALRSRFRVFRNGPMERIGGEYGGWTVPPIITADWVCFTVGVGEEAALDIALAERGCTVVAIDPTPRAVAYAAPIVAAHSSLSFLPYALSTADETLQFYAPQDPSHVSFSAVNRQATNEDTAIEVQGRTLESIMVETGLARVDFLKLDIEGSEYSVLPAIDLDAAGVQLLCVEFHDDRGLAGMVRAISDVTQRGFKVVSVHRTDVTFVRTSSN